VHESPPAESSTTAEEAEREHREQEERERERRAASPEGAVQAVEEHWNNIARGNFSAAYETCTVAACEPESVWVPEEEREHVESVAAQHFQLAPGADANEATVRVDSLRTISRETGCKTWTGYYSMVKEGGAWKINAVHLEPGAC
jgi:hypothetical protein